MSVLSVVWLVMVVAMALVAVLGMFMTAVLLAIIGFNVLGTVMRTWRRMRGREEKRYAD